MVSTYVSTILIGWEMFFRFVIQNWSQVKTQYAWSHHFFSLWELAVARRFVPMFDSSAGPLGSEKIEGLERRALHKRSCWMLGKKSP